MTPRLRKFTLSAHITSSVGWVGAVLVFLALAVIGLTSQDDLTVRGAYGVMEPAAWFVLVPLAHASLLTGVVISLASTWGLFRHYWVVLKLAITLFATIILLIYMETFRQMAGLAFTPSVGLARVRNPSPLVHAILALVLLLIATGLAVYKPLGMTSYGRRKDGDERRELSRTTLPGTPATRARPTGAAPRWLYVSGIVAIALILLLAIMHLTGGGSGRH